MIDESKNVQTTPIHTYCTSAGGPSPTVIQIVGRPTLEVLPSTIAPPNHPCFLYVVAPHKNPLNGTVLMMGHRICFCGEIWLIVPKLSLLNKNNKL